MKLKKYGGYLLFRLRRIQYHRPPQSDLLLCSVWEEVNTPGKTTIKS